MVGAAARAILREHVADNGDANAIWAENLAIAALAAAFPGLASDPPTAWVAPRHMTDAMVEAIEGKVSHMDRSTDELVNFDFAQADRFWRAARDAHTKEQGGT